VAILCVFNSSQLQYRAVCLLHLIDFFLIITFRNLGEEMYDAFENYLSKLLEETIGLEAFTGNI
jgi:hypothetical protein